MTKPIFLFAFFGFISVVPAQALDLADYSFRLKEAFQRAHQSVTETLTHSEEQKGHPWHLSTIGVGVNLGLEAGLGKVAHLEASPSFQLLYTRDKVPVFP